MVLKIHAKMQIVSSYDVGGELRCDMREFLDVDQIAKLLEGKHILYMNAYTLRKHQLNFIHPDTLFVCIAPIREEGALVGLIIDESRNPRRSMTPSDENAVMHICKVIQEYIAATDLEAVYGDAFSSKAAAMNLVQQSVRIRGFEAAPIPDGGQSPLRKLRRIAGINVDRALLAMGGMEELYLEASDAFTRMLPGVMQDLDDSLKTDLDAFKVNIHKLKSSLASIGFFDHQKTAAAIEQLAAEGDWDGCRKEYYNFRQVLSHISASMNEYFEQRRAEPGKESDRLDDALAQAREHLMAFNAPKALGVLRGHSAQALGPDKATLLAELIARLEAYDIDGALASVDALREQRKQE